MRATRELTGIAPDRVPYADLLADNEPVILKGLAAHWPLVAAGRDGSRAAMDYLKRFSNGQRVVGYTAPPDVRGRFHYNEALTGMNFAAERVDLADYLERIAAHFGDRQAPAFYIGSTDLDGYLPGLRAENDLVLSDLMFESQPPLVSIWIGNRTTAAAHHDMSNNMACCMVGRRRFTLFPPDQISNLYPGPLEPTPGGQVVTMVDLRNPDLDRYPRFAQALAAGQVAELEPGDVLLYPALWWHQVDARDEFNVMINYWWNVTPAFMDTPQNTLLHALLSLRDRPQAEKDAWRAMFDYYVFGPAARAGAHLPEHARGPLAPLDDMAARRLRATLLHKLNR